MLEMGRINRVLHGQMHRRRRRHHRHEQRRASKTRIVPGLGIVLSLGIVLGLGSVCTRLITINIRTVFVLYILLRISA